MIVLAGDVGGTNARLALVEIDQRSARVLKSTTYPSPEYPGLMPIIQRFLAETGERPQRASFGVPGPVVDGRCSTPNLAWQLDARELATGAGIGHTLLINDFSAVGYGVGWLGDGDVVTLQRGEPRELGQVTLVGAGTGFGVGFRVFDGMRWKVVASEGGHALFGARTDDEWALSAWLRARYGHPSWEHVVSGPGLVNIYRFLVSRGETESTAVRDAMGREDPAAVISRSALAGADATCARAMDMFISAYGAAAGTYGVIGVATGGVYLAGGIAPRLVDRLQSDLFLESFRGTNQQRAIAEKLPVHVIVRGDVGVIGAAVAALDSD
jgi:glucokinase